MPGHQLCDKAMYMACDLGCRFLGVREADVMDWVYSLLIEPKHTCRRASAKSIQQYSPVVVT